MATATATATVSAPAKHPVTVMLPPVRASGGRTGFNQAVTGVGDDGNITGERTAYEGVIEMLPGDLLLNVRPAGGAKDSRKNAALFYVQRDGSLGLILCLPWPEDKDRLARRIKAYFDALRVRDEVNAEAAVSCESDVFRQSVRRALSEGLSPAVLMGIVRSEATARPAQTAIGGTAAHRDT